MAGVRMIHVQKRLDDNRIAVNDLSLEIEDGEFIILAGPTGSGKSTVLRLLAGLETVSRGEIHLADVCVNELAAKDRDIAMVFPNYSLFPRLTVADNLAFGLRRHAYEREAVQMQILKVAQMLDIEHLLACKPRALSPLQRRVAALGRAVIRHPGLVLLDEPLLYLDDSTRDPMLQIILKLHQRMRTTFLYATQDIPQATAPGTRMAVMQEGVLQQFDRVEHLRSEPVNTFVARYMIPSIRFEDAVVYVMEEHLRLAGSDTVIDLPLSAANEPIQACNGKTVVLGIVPESALDQPVLVFNRETGISVFHEPEQQSEPSGSSDFPDPAEID